MRRREFIKLLLRAQQPPGRLRRGHSSRRSGDRISRPTKARGIRTIWLLQFAKVCVNQAIRVTKL